MRGRSIDTRQTDHEAVQWLSVDEGLVGQRSGRPRKGRNGLFGVER